MNRIWRRFEESRARAAAPVTARWSWALPAAALAGAAATGLVMSTALLPEQDRVVTLEAAGEQVVHEWSEQVRLELAGHGTATGTAKDVVVQWESGTLHVDVLPKSGTALSVVTDEAVISVVGTAFQVRRDPLGVTTTVEHGRVAVRCDDGWSGDITPDTEPHTCLPTRPGALLGRADFLTERGAEAEVVLTTLDLGLASADAGSAVEGELLARRLRVLGEVGRIDDALHDADRYLASGQPSRRVEVLRSAGRLALTSRGCSVALPYLVTLEPHGSPEDQVLLASCVAASDPGRARALVVAGLEHSDEIDPAWRAWATSFLGEQP